MQVNLAYFLHSTPRESVLARTGENRRGDYCDQERYYGSEGCYFINAAIVHLEKEIQKLEDAGAALKDIAIGLVDFVAVRFGIRTRLCQKLGEKEVTFWHSLHEGCDGRKPVKKADEFLQDDLAIGTLIEVLPTLQH